MPKLETRNLKLGIYYYATTYGNTCKWVEGEATAYDMDMGEEIPIDLVEFDKPIYI